MLKVWLVSFLLYLCYMKTTTNILIKNVTEENQYKGSYKRIFNILNKDSISCETYETEKSVGLKEGNYYLEIERTLDCNEEELISKLKNVTIINN